MATDMRFLLCQVLARNLPADVIADNQWPDLVELALQHDVAPMLHYAVLKQNTETLPAPLDRTLTDAALQSAIRFELLAAAQREIDSALKLANIPCLWLKGIALAGTIYPQPYLRPMIDLDVLVPMDSREAALEVVMTLGYHMKGGVLFGNGQDQVSLLMTNHYVLTGGLGDCISLELHYRLLNLSTDAPRAASDDWVWNHVTLDSQGYQNLEIEALFVHLCGHIMQHTEFENASIKQFLDVHLLITTKSLDWEKIIELGEELRWSYMIEYVLRTVEQLFSSPIPESVYVQLQAQRLPDENVRFLRLLHRSNSSHLSLLRRLTRFSPREWFQVTARILVPPRSYMRSRYNVPSWVPVFPYYCYRWLLQAGKLVKMLFYFAESKLTRS